MRNNYILSREQSRELDRRAIENYGIPGMVLMENAGRGVVDYLMSCHAQGSIIICCGKGNNAGDGFVIARHLDNLNFNVNVLLFSDPHELKGDAKLNYEIMLKSEIPLTQVDDFNFDKIVSEMLFPADWIIDALFGTGLQGRVRHPFDKVIQAINTAKACVLAVDIPSGLDCDTGEALGEAVKADHTVTFVGYKKGFLNPSASQYIGKVHIVDIGIPKKLQS